MSIASLTEGLVKLGFIKKGNSMKKIDELLIELYVLNRGKIINLESLFQTAGSKLASF